MVLASNASDKMWMPIVKVIKCGICSLYCGRLEFFLTYYIHKIKNMKCHEPLSSKAGYDKTYMDFERLTHLLTVTFLVALILCFSPHCRIFFPS